jgi:hypothetical protein
MIQLTNGGTVVSAPAHHLERLRAEFEERHCILLPGFMEPGLLKSIQRGLDRSEFFEMIHERIGVELCLKPGTISAALEFLTNSQLLFKLIRRITGCGPIGCFSGRVYRMVSSSRHYASWHSDVADTRMIAMTINLSTDFYQGGVLQIRHHESKLILHEVANVGFGDAILFRVSPDLRHRISPVEGSAAKTAYAGWFQSEPDYASLAHAAFGRVQSAAIGG